MNFDSKKTIFIIDGSSFLYRAYYSLRPLHTPQGIPVQAVYGFCRMIKKLIDTYKPEYIALVWDSKGKTTRHELYKEYKATRQAPPADLYDQKDYIIRFADLIGLHQMQKSGIEADDIMYSLAKEQADDNAIVFLTMDKDMGQAITLGDQVFILDTFNDVLYDRTKFEAKMGFDVRKMPFYFSLLGDTSDNIPGVRGIGKATALELVGQFDSLEDLYSRLHEIKKPRAKTILAQNKESAFLSRELFLLQYDKTGVTKEDVRFDAKNWSNARPLFEELNFKSLLEQLGQPKSEKADIIQDKIAYWKKYNFVTVVTRDDLQRMCDDLRQQGAFATDTETNGLDSMTVDLVGISFCAKEGQAYYVPCGHTTHENQLALDDVIAEVKPILQDSSVKKYLHNVKYDAHVFSRYGIELAGVAMDTFVAASLIVKEWQSTGLKKLSAHYFNEEMLSFDDVAKFFHYKDFSQVPLELATLYSAADSHQTVRLASVLQKEFEKNQQLKLLYETIEHPLETVLYKMEKEGIYCNVEMLKKLDIKVVQELRTIEEKIAAVVEKKDINLNSPRQIEELLFYKLQLPPQKKSPTGRYSTDSQVLAALADIHPVPAMIIKYRELSKLKSTYIDTLPTHVNPKTNRIHTTFSQTRAATGRLASLDPNLQNIPADGTGYGIEVRAAFTPKEGNIFISADYSQIELRVLAYLSQDKNLIDAFLQGHDIHTETTARLFGVPLEAVTHDQRQIGKRINFSILYGLTPYGLSKDLNISFKDAKHYIDIYFQQYPGVSAWMEGIIAATLKTGYVETLYGRRRYIPNIHERNRVLYEEACRVAVNTVAQGTAAEIMKLGMINLDREFMQQVPQAHMVLQIHDELLISVSTDYQAAAQELTKKVLESVVTWNVPLVVSISSGFSWKDVTK